MSRGCQVREHPEDQPDGDRGLAHRNGVANTVGREP